jgi:hypothetical protein
VRCQALALLPQDELEFPPWSDDTRVEELLEAMLERHSRELQDPSRVSRVVCCTLCLS